MAYANATLHIAELQSCIPREHECKQYTFQHDPSTANGTLCYSLLSLAIAMSSLSLFKNSNPFVYPHVGGLPREWADGLIGS